MSERRVELEREVMQVHCRLPSSDPVSVIAVVLPITRDIRQSNYNMKEITSVRWNHTLWRGRPFVCDVSRHVVNQLRQKRNSRLDWRN